MSKETKAPIEPITLEVQDVVDGQALTFTDVSKTGFKAREVYHWVLYLKAPKGATIVFKAQRPDEDERYVGKTIVLPEGFESAISVPRAAKYQAIGYFEVEVITGEVWAAQFGGFNASEG